MKIEQKFKQLRKQGKAAFMPFLVAGDPDFSTSLKVARILSRHADLLEIGFPYSDPLADGPTIQAADQRALKAGMNTDRVFEFVKKIREETDMPITLLVYANLVYQRGLDRFYKEAKECGVDGVLIPDVPVEEVGPYVAVARKTGIDQIFLVAQTTTAQRFKRILQHAQGYLYLVSVLGTTGAREEVRPETFSLIKRTKARTNLPVAVGFGISKPTHIALLKEAGVDGYIVGSALVKIIEENERSGKKIFEGLEQYAKSLTNERT